MKKILIIILPIAFLSMAMYAVDIAPGGTVTQNFTIGTSATATLPTDWKVDKNATARSVGTYSAAGTATELIAGNSMPTNAANGIYNYAAGVPESATDRAVGGLSSGTASKSVNVYVKLTNNGSSSISSFTLSYNVEKYRMGTNSAGFSIQMYYSTDGSSWTSAGSDFLTSFAGSDASNNGYATAPGATSTVTNKTLAQTLAVNGSIYLAWNYSVTSGTTTSNAQALGVDDVSITANAGNDPLITVNPISLTGFTYVYGSGPSQEKSFDLTGSNLTGNVSVSSAGTDYEIASTSGGTFGTSLTYTPISGSVSATVYVQLKDGLAISSYNNETITASSSGAANKTVTCSGTVTSPPPPIAPVANSASNVGVDAFTANWGTVDGATKYYLDVSTSSTFLSPTSTVLAAWNFTDGDLVVDVASANNTSQALATTASGTITPASGGEIYCNGWDNGSGSKYWQIEVNSTGFYGMTISSKQKSSGTGPRDFKIQYRIGSGGTWTDVPNTNITVADNYVSGVVNQVALPTACENQASVFIRWIMTSNTNVNGSTVASTGTSRIDDISIVGYAPSFITGWNNKELTSNSDIVTGLSASTTYYYRVRAYNAYGTSGNSNVISVTTLATPALTVDPTSLSDFSYIVGNGPSAEQTFTLTGTDVTADVFVSAGEYWEVASSPSGSFGSSLQYSPAKGSVNETVRVRLKAALSVGIYNNASMDKLTVYSEGAEDKTVTLSGHVDEPLPIVLSSFTASISAQNYVTLTWVTQTETGMAGYYIYRALNDQLSTAQMVSPLIDAVNGSQQHIYSYTDSDLYNDGTYFYWLESRDIDGNNHFFGPISIIYDNSGEYYNPEIPLLTELKAVYPNPFNPTAFIPFSLAATNDVSFKIYNNRGQIVRDINLGSKIPGEYRITWDGTDNNGQTLANGVYYIRMSAGKDSFQRKAVLLK